MKIGHYLVIGVIFFGCKNRTDPPEASQVQSAPKLSFLPFNIYKSGPLSNSESESLKVEGLGLSESFDRQDIGKYQIAGSDKTGTPRSLQGIWWMDGNPISDETVSFAKVDFTSAKPLFPIYGVNNFSFHGGDGSPEAKKTNLGRDYSQGEQAFNMAIFTGAMYEFSFKNYESDPYGFGTILPVLTIRAAGFEQRFSISQNLFTFTLRKIDPDFYERETIVNGKTNEGYQLKRILVPSEKNPEELLPTRFWEEFISQDRPKKLRVVVRR